MAYPNIVINNSTGSDTNATGTGPSAALTGISASTDAAGTVVALDGSPDLTGVATDGTHVIWLKATGGVEFARIVAADNTLKTVTVDSDQPFPASLTGLTWIIGGGPRATLDHVSTRKTLADSMGPWNWEIQYTGTDYTLTSELNDFGQDKPDNSGDPQEKDVPEIYGTGSVRPRVTASTDIYLFNMGSDRVVLRRLELVGPGSSLSTKAALRVYYSVGLAIDCVISGFKYGAQILQNSTRESGLYGCDISACTDGVYLNGALYGSSIDSCDIHDNSNLGIYAYRASAWDVRNTLIRGNGSHGMTLNSTSTSYATFARLTIYGNGGSGVYFDNKDYWALGSWKFSDCVIVNNSGYGMERRSVNKLTLYPMERMAFYGNTSGKTSGYIPLRDEITITGDPFIDAANGDFRLNDTAGAGAVLRGAGLGVYGQTDNQDVGAVQHSDPAGGGGTTIITRPRRVM